jgi:hypothetical protein
VVVSSDRTTAAGDDPTPRQSDLDENQRVEFDVTQGPKGPQAENVRPV